MTPKLRIAIIGGGLAGAALANAFLNQPHVDVHIYESAPEFSERGLAVGLAVNAQRALAKLVPDAEALLARAGAVPMNSTRLMMGSGPKAGTKVLDFSEKHPLKLVHRAALLHELLAPISRANMHAGKKLVSIEELGDELSKPNDVSAHTSSANKDTAGLLLHFSDSSTTQADMLIGADGIFGSVRSHVLGPEHPATQPVAAGWAGMQMLVPFAKARDMLGAEYFEKYFQEDRQYGWIGNGGFMMHDLLSNRELVQCIATGAVGAEDEASAESSEAAAEDAAALAGTKSSSHAEKSAGKLLQVQRRPIDRAYLEKKYAAWLTGPVAPKMIDLLLSQDDPAVYTRTEHRNAPTYVRGRVCIAGDAAHAMTPFQGSGAATALEDAVVLGALVAEVCRRDEQMETGQLRTGQVQAVLTAYDTVQRPRAQQIVESSRLTGRIMTGLDESAGVDVDKMRAALTDRWEFIHDFDLERHIEEVKRKLDEILAGVGS